MAKIKLPNVRINFARIFKAEGFQGSEENKKFNAQFILNADDPVHMEALEKLREEIDRVGQEKWGAKWRGGKMSMKGFCLKSGDPDLQDEQFVTGVEIEDDDGNIPDYVLGTYQVSASETKRPTVVHRDKTPLTEEDAVIYDGCRVNAIVSVWAQDNKFGKRINANLLGVQFRGDDEPFGTAGEKVTDDDFDDDFDDEDDV